MYLILILLPIIHHFLYIYSVFNPSFNTYLKLYWLPFNTLLNTYFYCIDLICINTSFNTHLICIYYVFTPFTNLLSLDIPLWLHHLLQSAIWEYLLPFIPCITNCVFHFHLQIFNETENKFLFPILIHPFQACVSRQNFH